jgi:hypothetical protein
MNVYVPHPGMPRNVKYIREDKGVPNYESLNLAVKAGSSKLLWRLCRAYVASYNERIKATQ